MKLQNNITVFSGDTRNNAQAEWVNKEAAESSDKKSKTIYAGNLLPESPLRDRIQQRRAQAQQRAMKIVGDAWDGDRKIEGLIEEREERLRDLRATYKEAKDRIVEIGEESDALREAYGVDPDSEEQQYLDLMLKEQAANWPGSGVTLTKEESERLYQYRLQSEGLTEYQERQLQLNGQIGGYQLVALKAEAGIEKENAVIRGIREERRKVHPMADAQKQAEEVMEAARDEAIGMIVDDAKDHIDQEQEKKEEEAEAIKEKKEEQEKIQEKRDEREEELKEIMEDMPLDEMADMKNVQAGIQQEVQNIMNKMNLVEEDIKGAKVDASL